MKNFLHRDFLKNLLKDIFSKISTGVLFATGILLVTFTVWAFQAPTGGDTNPATAGYTSASSWVSTNITGMISTLTAIKAKTDTITTGSSFCDPNVGKYCNIKPTCDGTEAGVTVDASKGTGYCIEKSERAAQTWELAKMTCENLGKRLPEPFEWKYGCKNAATLGLLTMTDNWEWASNTTLPLYSGASGGVGAAIFGAGGCAYAAWGWLGYNTSVETLFSFRCVR